MCFGKVFLFSKCLIIRILIVLFIIINFSSSIKSQDTLYHFKCGFDFFLPEVKSTKKDTINHITGHCFLEHKIEIKDKNNKALKNRKINTRIKIFLDSINGDIVYSKSDKLETDSIGNVNIVIKDDNNFNCLIANNRNIDFLMLEVDTILSNDYLYKRYFHICEIPTNILRLKNRYEIGFKPFESWSDDKINRRIYDSIVKLEKSIPITYTCEKGSQNFVLLLLIEVPEKNNFIEDLDKNRYLTVKFGNQTWMIQNLKTTKYNDGSNITLIEECDTWANTNMPGYCWYVNDSINYKYYGALYNFKTVLTNKICPAGWHVPTFEEFMEFHSFIFSKYDLKDYNKYFTCKEDIYCQMIIYRNKLITNNRYSNGSFYYGNIYWNKRFLWTSTSYKTAYNIDKGVYMELLGDFFEPCEQIRWSKIMNSPVTDFNMGFCIRCLKDKIEEKNKK